MPGFQIGFLVATDKNTWKNYISAFEGQLTALGWTLVTRPPKAANEIHIVYSREAQGDPGQFSPIAAALIGTPVDILVTAGTAPARACKDATSSIPIVFAAAGDPVGGGLVSSLKAPGGNVTGGCNQQVNLAVKRVEELREQWMRSHPGTPVSQLRLGIIGTGLANSPAAAEMQIVAAAAADYGLSCQPPAQIDQNHATSDISTKIQNLRQQGVNCIYVCSDPVITSNADHIGKVCKAGGSTIETMHAFREYHDHHGGTWSYGASFTEMFTKAADYVDQILKGTANPATLPVFEPSTVESVPPW